LMGAGAKSSSLESFCAERYIPWLLERFAIMLVRILRLGSNWRIRAA
jgi:hypothetical protein